VTVISSAIPRIHQPKPNGLQIHVGTVILVPQEKERLDQIAYYGTVTTDQHGRFTIKVVDPGEYKLPFVRTAGRACN
jgi:hypothetical protein